MHEMIRRRLTYANVMSTIAAFGVLATGSAYARLADRRKDIKPDAIRAKHVKKNQVKAKHITRNAIATSKIRDGAVTEAKLADGFRGRQGPAGPRGRSGTRRSEGR